MYNVPVSLELCESMLQEAGPLFSLFFIHNCGEIAMSMSCVGETMLGPPNTGVPQPWSYLFFLPIFVIA